SIELESKHKSSTSKVSGGCDEGGPRVETASVDIPDCILIAIYLNPACAAHDFLSAVLWNDGKADVTLRDKVKALLVKELIERYQEDEARHVERQEPAQMQILQQEEIPFKRQNTGIEYQTVMRMSAQMAVALYECETSHHKEQRAQFIEIPQDYWRLDRNNERLRDLARIARIYLCFQATSSESERLFSKAGRVLSSRKTRLNDSIFRDIIFASSFEKYLLHHG
ncbi:hypothetical protein BGW38_003897, partial [Lunasporangiospora selenospora]